MTAPTPLLEIEIPAEWVDYNNHLNDAYHAVAFSRAGDVFLESIGLGAEGREATGCTIYTLALVIRYLAEAKLGDPAKRLVGCGRPASAGADVERIGSQHLDAGEAHGVDRRLRHADPVGARRTPPVLRAPNGVVLDGRDYWSAGKALYDPAGIRVPTFLAHAEWDADLPSYQAQEYFTKLTHAPYKRFVELGEGTHTVMMEKNRMQFLHAVGAFLTEADPQALN